MSSYIKSETYRILRNKWTYLFIGICSVLLVSANIVLAAVKLSEPDFPYANTAFSFSNLYSNMYMIFLLCVMVASMIFGNEYSNHTLKNSISYGIPRGTIYFGKLIVQVVYAIAAFSLITGIYVLSGYLLLENSGIAELEMILKATFVCLPLFLFALATTNCFSFIMESTGASVTAIILTILAFPMVSSFLGMKFKFFANLSRVLPWNMITSIGYDYKKHLLIFYWDTQLGYQMYWLAGILQMVLFILIGYTVFRKKEIK